VNIAFSKTATSRNGVVTATLVLSSVAPHCGFFPVSRKESIRSAKQRNRPNTSSNVRS
jgi:hypothetical protein